MGRPKAALELGGKPLALWAATTVRAVTTRWVQVGGEPIAGLGWEVLADRRPGAGPAAGLEAALAAAEGAVVVIAVDLPLAPAALLREALRRVDAGALAAVPRWRGRWQPLCGAYAPDVLPTLRRRLDAGEHDLQGLLDLLPTSAIGTAALGAFGDAARQLLNVNTPDDLERARSFLGS